jgi:PIN domain nuclease of toxin-antitoxin system
MSLLLDSHAALWVFEDSHRLSKVARDAIAAPGATVLVSAASAYELTWKSTLGKLPPLPRPFMALAIEHGFSELPIAGAHAEFAARLAPVHKDPWDRLLAAQAIMEGLTLVSCDEGPARLGAAVLW